MTTTITESAILVVDDEEYLRRMVVRILATKGYVCTQAANGAAALGEMAARDFALVISDIMACEIALSHHEHYDGTGYPQGLHGSAIPAAARIVAICDVYDALVHDRVYRPALPEAQAWEIMLAGRGTHFDAEIFDRFYEQNVKIRDI